MPTLRYAAAPSAGGRHTVTRSTSDGLAGSASLLFTDALAGKLVLRELVNGVSQALAQDWRKVSKPGQAPAFRDGATFADGAFFTDQSGAHYLASIAASGSTITKSASASIGSADAALLLDTTKSKPELRAAIDAIGRALQFDSLRFTSLGSYPTEGSLAV